MFFIIYLFVYLFFYELKHHSCEMFIYNLLHLKAFDL